MISGEALQDLSRQVAAWLLEERMGFRHDPRDLAQEERTSRVPALRRMRWRLYALPKRSGSRNSRFRRENLSQLSYTTCIQKNSDSP